jgi:uncharacterized protein YukE
MSPQVGGDPEELRRFAAALKQYRMALEQSTYGMEARTRQLGDSWRDAEYQKFLNEWETARRSVDRLLDACEGYISHISIKAQRLQDYLDANGLR